MKRLFRLHNGVIPACDVWDMDDLRRIVESTHDIKGIVGFKVGSILGLRYGLAQLVKTVREHSDLPIVYDHQKAGTDIPQMGKKFASVCAEAGVEGVIVFPQSGPLTEEEFIKALEGSDLVPIVGGEMTHPKYLVKDGGFITDEGPAQMYKVAADRGVDHFVIPGNKPEDIRNYHKLLSQIVEQPKYCLPGIGRQGGDVKSAFEALQGSAAYAIVGSGIYGQRDMREAAKRLCDEAVQFAGD